MLSDKMIVCGEKLKPNEQRIRGFFGKKTVKLLISGIIAAAFIILTLFFTIKVVPSVTANRILAYIICGLIFLVMFVGIGEFFANIGIPAYKKYAISDIVAMAVVMPAAIILSLFCNVDLEWFYANLWQTIWRGLAEGLLWFGIPLALSLILGRFAFHRKKRK